MAAAAKGLEVRRIPGITAALQRDHVVDLQTTRPTAGSTPPGVPLQDAPADVAPPAPGERGVVTAHNKTLKTLVKLPARRKTIRTSGNETVQRLPFVANVGLSAKRVEPERRAALAAWSSLRLVSQLRASAATRSRS